MLAIQMWCRCICDEKLAAIGVGSSICTAEQAWHVMCQFEVLVLKCLPVDALASRAISTRKVTSLQAHRHIGLLDPCPYVLIGQYLNVQQYIYIGPQSRNRA